MIKMKVSDIKTPDWLTLDQVATIPKISSEWFQFEEYTYTDEIQKTLDEHPNLFEAYSFDTMLKEQSELFVRHYMKQIQNQIIFPKLLLVENLEWVCNTEGRHYDYDSELTVWVTAIVDIENNKIVRVSFDLFDSMMLSDNGITSSGTIY